MEFNGSIHPFFKAQYGHGNVVFNLHSRSPIDDLSVFALGFHMAGKALVDRLESARGYADYEAYPIFFLYRHSLELYLKAIVYRGARLLGLISDEKINTDKLFSKHDLARWLPAIKAIFENLEWVKDFGIPNIRNFEDFSELVIAVDKIDPQSYTFHYPVDTKGASALPEHFVLNAISFGKNMDQVLQVLDGAVTGLDEHLYTTAEALDSFREVMQDS